LCDLLATPFRESFAMNFSRCLTFGAKASGSRDAITSNRILSSVKRALGRLITHGLEREELRGSCKLVFMEKT
jgi:hypothetical protein